MAVSSLGFADAVKNWTEKTEAKLEGVFKLSFEMTVEAVQDLTPIKTGFLRNSLTVTIGEIAHIDPAATGKGGARVPVTPAAIASARLGDTLSAGFVAAYARRIEYGFEGTDSLGRSYNQKARAMVRLGVQRFPEFVQAAIKRAG
jgi:hypothetical protein